VRLGPVGHSLLALVSAAGTTAAVYLLHYDASPIVLLGTWLVIWAVLEVLFWWGNSDKF
jgi:hypothetical protein